MKFHHVLVCVLFTACGGAAATNDSVSSPAAASPQATLDGRSFDVVLNIPDSPAQKDTLRFANGKFESTACTALGFPEWSDYAAHPIAEGTAFHVLAKHPSGTTMDWNGSIKGSAVEGTANRTMNGKTDVLSFKGALQP